MNNSYLARARKQITDPQILAVVAAKRAKQLGYDAVHDTVHEMCKDEARHGKGFDGLLKRYFGK